MSANDSSSSPLSIYDQSKANFRRMVADIGWFGFALPATSQFLAIYAIRLDASPALLGWLAALPSIVALISSSLAQWWRKRYPGVIEALYWPALGHRLTFLLPALTPFFPKEWQLPWLVFAAALPAFPMGISSVIFLVMMRISVDKSQITALTGRRSMFLNITVSLGTLAFGFWLKNVRFPFNYQSMFVTAFMLSLVSWLMVMRIQPIEAEPLPQPDQAPVRPWRSPRFRRSALFSTLTHIAVFSLVPVVPLRLVDDLGADEGFMSIFAMCGTVGGTIMSAYAHRIVSRIGSQVSMVIGMAGAGLGGAIIGLTGVLPLTAAASFIAGFFWTLAAIGQFAFFVENTSPENITRYTTLYNQVIMLAVFAGPMIGSQLASTPLSVSTVILLGAGLRMLVALVISADGVGEVRRTRRAVALR